MNENNGMDEISLRELIETLIKRKKAIALITAGFILLSAIFSFVVLSPTYEAKMILMTSNLGNGRQDQNVDVARVDDILNVMSQYPDMSIETYREQLKTPEVLDKTIKDLGLEEKYSIEGLANSIQLETVKDTQLITVKMESEDPELAANVVNTIGKNFVSFVSQTAKKKASKTFEYVETQMNAEKENYDKVLLELKELLSEPRGAKELELELNSSFEQITEFKSTLNELKIRKGGLLSAIEESSTGGKGSVTARPSIEGNLNISFENSREILEVDLAETRGRIDSLNTQITDLQKKIEKLQVEYQDKQHEENLIKQRVDISKKTYESFVEKYEELRVAETAKLGELSINIISKAYPSDRPVGPRKMLNIAIGAVLGLMVGVFYAFFREYWETSGENNNKVLVGEYNGEQQN